MYYIAFSDVGIKNPQDKMTYRNVYFIKKDLSEIVGLYFYSRLNTFSDYFEVSRISQDAFNKRVDTNNERLTSLYSDIVVKTYGDRKEYNNTLAVLYNMFIGVNQNYLVKNLTKGIAPVSKDIRDYADAMYDEKVARKGENGMYFFLTVAAWLFDCSHMTALMPLQQLTFRQNRTKDMVLCMKRHILMGNGR